jgi:hypothetical protein
MLKQAAFIQVGKLRNSIDSAKYTLELMQKLDHISHSLDNPLASHTLV